MNVKQTKRYTLGEEIFSSVSHGVGAALAIAGSAVVIVKSAFSGSAYAVVGASVYSATLIILYIMSTLYHSFTNPTAKYVFRIFDHCTIFLLIAGTYTPLTLVTLRGAAGWVVFGVIWGAAVLGIVLNAVNLERFKIFSIICYVAMGWAAIFTIRPIIAGIGTGGTVLLITGGVAYTAGLIFYAMKKHRYMHSIWHLFVLAGSILHYFCILLYVIP